MRKSETYINIFFNYNKFIILILILFKSTAISQPYPSEVLKLGEKKDPKSLTKLISFVSQDVDWWLRSSSAGALAKIGDTISVDYIVEALRKECIIWREGTVRGKDHPIYEEHTELPFANALIKLMNPKLKNELNIYLHENGDNSKFKFWVAYILAFVGEKEALPTLVYTLGNSERWIIRERSAYALGQLSDTTSITHLIHALEDSFEKPEQLTPPGFRMYPVRTAAKIALKRFEYKIEVSSDGTHRIIEE